jgi:hypothetical protein
MDCDSCTTGKRLRKTNKGRWVVELFNRAYIASSDATKAHPAAKRFKTLGEAKESLARMRDYHDQTFPDAKIWGDTDND